MNELTPTIYEIQRDWTDLSWETCERLHKYIGKIVAKVLKHKQKYDTTVSGLTVPKRLDRPDREKIEAILEPTLDRLYRRNLTEGKYKEIAVQASIAMLKSNLATQLLALFDEEELR